MPLPWNGVWDFDLLRDLCGGVTYSYSVDGMRSINVACQRCGLFLSSQEGHYHGVGTIEIQRFDKFDFRIKGFPPLSSLVEHLTEWLTEVHAVPINDDGTLWQVADQPPREEDDE